MADGQIIEALPEHIPMIAEDMREEDVLECLATGTSTEGALADGLRRSVLVWSVVCDGRPVAMFGIAPLTVLGDRGLPWMLSANGLERVPRALARTGPGYVAQMREVYPRLVNWVHRDNRRAIAFIRWLGFEVDEPEPYGPMAEPFRRFTMGGTWHV